MADTHYGTCSWTPEGSYDSRTPNGAIDMFGDGGHRAVELMLLSSAACLNFYLVEYARARNLPVTALSVTCTGEIAQKPERVSRIDTTITVSGGLDASQTERMVAICERACKVMNTLRQTPETVVHIRHED